MPRVKYVRNKDAREGTGAIYLGKNEDNTERLLEKGGPSLELTDGEYVSLQGRYELEEVAEEVEESEGTKPVELAADTANTTATQGVSSESETPSTPEQGS